MSSRRDDREKRDAGGRTESDDIDDLLSDLRTTLDRLDRTLREEAGRGDGRAGADRRTRPSPPSARELLRFTDEYTIPTLIAVLESTIRSLELLRGAIRLLDPDRAVRSEGDADRSRLPRPSDAAREEVAANARRALSELRTALAESDLPDDPESRDIIEDARGLSAEIERRIDESERRRRTGADRGDRDRAGGSVRIDVSEEGDGANGGGDGARRDDGGDDGGGGSDGADAAVDVEAELRSIKDEVEGARDGPAPDDGGDADGDGAGSDGR